MPSFYQSLPRQLPLTPPDYYGQHSTAASAVPPSAVSSYYGLNGSDGRYALDATDKFGYAKQPFHLAAAPAMRPSYGHDGGRQSMSKFTPASGREGASYGHMTAPILPPIRIPDSSMDGGQTYHAVSRPQSQISSQPPPAEEKVAGGVAAHLDYEMEQMVDFVAEMAQGIVLPNVTVTPAFRKYVSQILTSTRLPSSTILLGLHYLGTRMTMLSSSGVYSSSTGHLYHMLTTALMLGSKFLDDNTFQNRSWAEVSNISVAELNAHELDWLIDIKWDLHFDPSDPQGFSAWLKEWKIWQAKKVETAMESLKLTPLDVNLRRQQSLKKHMPLTPVYTPTYHDSFASQGLKDRTPSHWQMWPPLNRSLMERSPPSAPHTGPNTPDWYGRHGAIGYNQSTPTYPPHPATPMHVLPSSTQSPYYHPYTPQYTPTTWSGHSVGCMCGYCLPHGNDRYSMSQGYGVQSVVG